MGTFNCGAFVAGIVRVSASLHSVSINQLSDSLRKAQSIVFCSILQGVLDGAGFPAVVTAHFVPMEGQQRPRTTILIKFAEEVKLSLILFPFLFRANIPF